MLKFFSTTNLLVNFCTNTCIFQVAFISFLSVFFASLEFVILASPIVIIRSRVFRLILSLSFAHSFTRCTQAGKIRSWLAWDIEKGCTSSLVVIRRIIQTQEQLLRESRDRTCLRQHRQKRSLYTFLLFPVTTRYETVVLFILLLRIVCLSLK